MSKSLKCVVLLQDLLCSLPKRMAPAGIFRAGVGRVCEGRGVRGGPSSYTNACNAPSDVLSVYRILLVWDLSLGESALQVCADIGRSYHRTSCDERVSAIKGVLGHLAVVMTSYDTYKLPPAVQINKALILAEQHGHKCFSACHLRLLR